MDQQNYELDQTGAEETPKKKKGSTFKGIVIGVITPDKLDRNQRGMSGNQLTDSYHE